MSISGKPKERRIFLNNMNSWLSNFIIESMRTDWVTDVKVLRNIFMGTLNNSNNSLPYLFKPEIINIDYSPTYDSKVFTNSVFIYDLFDLDYNEIEYIIKGLKNLKYDNEKVLILISSPMTWARTTPKYPKKAKEEEDGQDSARNIRSRASELSKPSAVGIPSNQPSDNKIMTFELSLEYEETDFKDRVPTKKYNKHKMIETLALKAQNANPMLKTYVVCPGFLYGCGEDLFYDYFKSAWLQNDEPISLPGDGANVIPTIHIKDLVTFIKKLIEIKPLQNYFLAVDYSVNRSLQRIIQSIVDCIGNGKVVQTDPIQAESFPNYSEIMFNVKLKPSKFFEDKKMKTKESPGGFPWECEFGIAKNMEKLKSEFKEYRNLKATKIFITGPPLCGKTTLARNISSFVHLPIVNVQDLVDHAKSLEDSLGDEIKRRVEEIRDKMAEEIENATKKTKKKTDPPFDKSILNPRIPDDLLNKVLFRIISQNKYKNRGFILEGYPRSIESCADVFLTLKGDKEVRNPDIFPDFFFLVDMPDDEIIKSRAKALCPIDEEPEILPMPGKSRQSQMPKPVATNSNSAPTNTASPEIESALAPINSHYTEGNTMKRIMIYRGKNESTGPSIKDFFSDYTIEINRIDGALTETEMINQAKRCVEKDAAANLNILKLPEEIEAIGKGTVADADQNSISQSLIDRIDSNFDADGNGKMTLSNPNIFAEVVKEGEKEAEAAKEKSKVSFVSQIDILKEREKKLLERRTQVIRLYIMENVIPELSKGLIEVAKEMPDDPIPMLSEYLMRKSKEVLNFSRHSDPQVDKEHSR